MINFLRNSQELTQLGARTHSIALVPTLESSKSAKCPEEQPNSTTTAKQQTNTACPLSDDAMLAGKWKAVCVLAVALSLLVVATIHLGPLQAVTVLFHPVTCVGAPPTLRNAAGWACSSSTPAGATCNATCKPGRLGSKDGISTRRSNSRVGQCQAPACVWRCGSVRSH